MDSFLLNRQLGSVSPQALSAAQNQRLLGALQLAPDENYVWRASPSYSESTDIHENVTAPSELHSKAHTAGVNAITIDRFEGR